MATIRVTHFSDTLCVWAYVSQIRIDELQRRFAGKIELDYRYFHVFGNVPKKLETNWKDRGGAVGYAEHVAGVVARFDHVTLHPRVWNETVPPSSMPSHLLLCAVRLLQQRDELEAGSLACAAWALRQAFFAHGQDIARHDVLFEVAAAAGLPVPRLEHLLASGEAHAALAEDLDLARQQAVQASPTLLFNEGRQRLTGNVGYRIIEANIRELLEGAPGQLSWC